MRRVALAKCSPAFVFCQTHDLASGIIPKKVLEFKKLVFSEYLPNGLLPSSSRESLMTQLPDYDFPLPSSAILPAPLQVTGIESNTLHPSILPMKMPSLRSGIVIHANQFFNSRFRQLRRQIKSPPIDIDETFSPFTHPGLGNTPAFAVIEVKAGSSDLQEAQMQAGVVGGAILRKARQIGAPVEAVPCVPAVVAFGATWYLNLTYDEPDLIVTSTPWIIGGTITFLGTLKVVLFIEQLRSFEKANTRQFQIYTNTRNEISPQRYGKLDTPKICTIPILEFLCC
ncbi:hypothetical protein TWF217_005982 [Orbilia oligospora]|nr:hypothetical protein TWF217_005982 [Orbilia oligospora]